MTALALVPDTAVKAKPFLRWTGSKAKLLPELLKWVPTHFGTFHEVFLGSGALFFELRQHTHFRAILTDANNWLTCTFSAIQLDLEVVLPPLRVYAEMYAKHGAAFYTYARDAVDPNDMTAPELAAFFIFLNKTNFNGIFRVNGSGKYNVPAGKFASPPTVCNEPLLRACSEALHDTLVMNSDFRGVETRAVAGDFCYFDSPYIPTSDTANFTGYTAAGFRQADQVALRDLALRLKTRGVHVLLSNSDTPVTRELYKGFEIREVSRGGGMNSDPTKRAKVTELLMR